MFERVFEGYSARTLCTLAMHRGTFAMMEEQQPIGRNNREALEVWDNNYQPTESSDRSIEGQEMSYIAISEGKE